MKIGILTFQRADNYGAMLQCYALFDVLKKQGHDVEVIDYRSPSIERPYRRLPKIRKNIVKWGIDAVRTIRMWSKEVKRREAFDKMRQMLIFSQSYTAKEIKKNGLPYDLIITGSDQVWNPMITEGLDDIYYLDFPGNFVRCSYAASMGSIEQEIYRSSAFCQKLSKFEWLSLREKDAVDFIADLTNKETVCCLDPTLLLSRQKWENIIEGIEVSVEQDYILLYYIEDNTEEIKTNLIKMAKWYSEYLGIPIVCCSRFKQNIEGINWISEIGPLEFVKLIANAKSVITSSFHATVFSAMFERDARIVLHSKTGARVRTLAKTCGFESHIYGDFDDFKCRYQGTEMISLQNACFVEAFNRSQQFLDDVVEYTECCDTM